MNRDQKIGLSFGILLIGAVAAFFYRHEQPKALPLPELRSAAELDAQIAERPHAPYLEPSSRTQTEPLDSTTEVDADADSQAGLVPEPIALETMLKQHGISSTSLSNPADQPRQSVATASTPAVHTVRSGETLSSIAAEYLGNANRFYEIYEANRDRLRDANDLRVGQELRLPVAARPPGVTTSSTAALPAARNDPPAESSTEGAQSRPAKLFVPVPGPRSLPRSGTPLEAEASSAAGKRLSQMPPEDVIIRR